MPGEADRGTQSVGSPVSKDMVATLVDRVLEVLEAKLRIRDIGGVSVPIGAPIAEEASQVN